MVDKKRKLKVTMNTINIEDLHKILNSEKANKIIEEVRRELLIEQDKSWTKLLPYMDGYWFYRRYFI